MRYSQTQLNEIILRDWAVRVLDAWVAVAVGRSAHLDNHSVAPKFDAVLFSERSVRREYAGPTPDAARLAAAEAIWPELTESVRAELGERP